MLMPESLCSIKNKKRQDLWRRLSPGGLEHFYRKYNRREFVHPDPLEFLYDYTEVKDREIVGLIASGLAYGRVKMILAATSQVLKKIGAPHTFVKSANHNEIQHNLHKV